MQVRNIIENINFHDSNVIELFHENNKVKLRIDLCMWKQEGYKEGDDELREVLLEFDSVENYVWDADKTEADIDYDTILEILYDNGIVKIVLANDEVSVIIFKCSEVKYMQYFNKDVL